MVELVLGVGILFLFVCCESWHITECYHLSLGDGRHMRLMSSGEWVCLSPIPICLMIGCTEQHCVVSAASWLINWFVQKSVLDKLKHLASLVSMLPVLGVLVYLFKHIHPHRKQSGVCASVPICILD